MKELRIGNRVMLTGNIAASNNGFGFIGYVTYIKEFPMPRNYPNIFTKEEIDSGIGHHYWIEGEFKPKEAEPWSGKWSFRKDLKCLDVIKLDEGINVI
jgi:hypothetical protein